MISIILCSDNQLYIFGKPIYIFCSFQENITGIEMLSMCSSESFQFQTPEKSLTTILTESQRELKRISSKEKNSQLRTHDKESLASFSMDLVSSEMHEVMPTFTEYIENTIINPRQSRNKMTKGKTVEPEVISSTAKLLHRFNRDLNLFQSLNSIILLKGGCKQSAFDRLSSTGNCMSYQATLDWWTS